MGISLMGYRIVFQGMTSTNLEGPFLQFTTTETAQLFEFEVPAAFCAELCDEQEACVGFFLFESEQGHDVCRGLSKLGDPSGKPTQVDGLSYAQLVCETPVQTC